MRLNFRKVSAIAASALMVGATMGIAAAATYYPAPFVSGTGADVAVVYGTGDGVSQLDVVNAGNLQSDLSLAIGTGTGGTTGSVNGEATPLFSDGTKIYITDTINKVKSILTKSDLPSVLADGSFSGNVDATYTQTLVVGAYPNITYEKQPTSSDDPNLAIKLSSSTNSQAFNMTATFSKVVNFSHADSEGEEIILFGQAFTVSAATDATNLILLKSAEKVSLSSDSPTADVTIADKAYTIELVSASDTSATVKVTDKATGASEEKSIDEFQSKKIKGISIAVTTADENNLKYSASLVAGSEKVTLTGGSNVKVGETDTAVLGTSVDFGGASGPAAGISKITISVSAEDSDKDAIQSGSALVDPVFEAVKLSLAGFNIEETSASREEIKVEPNGDSKMQVTFTDHLGNLRTQRYALYGAGASNASLYVDDDHRNMSVREMEKIHRDDYAMVGNEDEGHLLRVSSAYRGVSGGTTASGDYLKFVDVMSNEELTATLISNTSTISSGSVDIGGKRYNVYLEGTPLIDSTTYNVSLDYPDSTVAESMVAFPTIETSKGAKLAFYEPLSFNVTNWKSNDSSATPLASILIPNGADTYQTITLSNVNATEASIACSTSAVTGNLQIGGLVRNGSSTCLITNTGFTYNFSISTASILNVQLLNAAANAPITEPAVMIFEEKDDNNVYEGLIVTTSPGASSENGCGVSNVERTWTDDTIGGTSGITLASDSKKAKKIDLFGTIITLDNGDSDQSKATISYPNNQVYALVYMAAAGATTGVSGGTGGGKLGYVLVKDTEVSSVSSKNLIVVGGSCINSVAANLVGEPACGSDFTSKTGVGSGQFLIQSFTSPYASTKVALLVAGYEAAETGWASTYLTTQNVETTTGKKYKGTSATSAELVTTTV